MINYNKNLMIEIGIARDKGKSFAELSEAYELSNREVRNYYAKYKYYKNTNEEIHLNEKGIIYLVNGLKFESEIIYTTNGFLEIFDIKDKISRLIPISSILYIEMNNERGVN